MKQLIYASMALERLAERQFNQRLEQIRADAAQMSAYGAPSYMMAMDARGMVKNHRDALFQALTERGEFHPRTIDAAKRFLGRRLLLRQWPGIRRRHADERRASIEEGLSIDRNEPSELITHLLREAELVALIDDPRPPPAWAPRPLEERGPPAVMTTSPCGLGSFIC